MLATVTGVGILAWAIGFFDPETCTPSLQQSGWTSCKEIAQGQSIALGIFVGVLATLTVFLSTKTWLEKRAAKRVRPSRLTTR
jgi:uncharacterized membrane protein